MDCRMKVNINRKHKRLKKENHINHYQLFTEYVAAKMDAKNDRAEQRRKAVGSSCEYEKTKTASLNAYVQNC